MSRTAIAGLLLVGCIAAACKLGGFACADDGDCAGRGDGATCEATGWCSFPDDSCTSGARYGTHAGDGLGGTCVELGGSSSSSSTSSEAGPTTLDASASLETSVSTTVTTTLDSSSTGGDAVCGNAVVEGDEACDDGNRSTGDGCNPDCVRSGEVAWSVVVGDQPVGFDGAFAIEAIGDGDIVVSVSTSLTPDSTAAGVWRLDANGSIVWQWQHPELAWPDPYGWGLDVLRVDGKDVIGTATTGTPEGVWRTAAATLGDDGELRWTLEFDGTGFGVALGPDDNLYVGGHDVDGVGTVWPIDAAGTAMMPIQGGPFLPDGGFLYDLLYEGPLRLQMVGQYSTGMTTAGFYQLSENLTSTSFDIVLGSDNEALAVARDPLTSLDWVVGYADPGGGWVATYSGTDTAHEAKVVTTMSPANLHGVAPAPDGGAVAIGWDSQFGDRDMFVVKLDAEGTVQWSRAYPELSGGDDFGRDVVVGADGSMFVVAQISDASGLATDGWIARLLP
ncbi:MAG: hypothetical protein K1X88_13215 [Nannocystaceae bacterium]|nr:hypothetical protein [Nannocystaceae bacterium]